MMINDDDFLRYQRQISLPEIGEIGQQKLANAHVLVIGCGGLSASASSYLAAAGIGRMVIADGDHVELSNLPRQVVFKPSDTGELKAKRLQNQLQQQNPHCQVRAIPRYLQQQELSLEIMLADIVLDCSDNLETRHAISQACLTNKTHLLSGAAIGWQGQFIWFDYANPKRDKQAPCYHCLVPQTVTPTLSRCSENGVIGPIVGMIGLLQALQAIKIITHTEQDSPNIWHRFDGQSLQWQQGQCYQDPTCDVCQQSNESKDKEASDCAGDTQHASTTHKEMTQ